MDFLNSVWYAFMILVIAIVEVVITITTSLAFDSIIVLGVNIVFWMWFNRMLTNWIVKWLDKRAAID